MTDDVSLSLGEKQPGVPYTFFVVDDSDFMVKNLTRMITSLGGRVIDSASDGEEALRKLSGLASSIDCVTLDITMPKKDGLTTLKEIRQNWPDLKVVMVSALGQEKVVKAAIVLGAKHFIVKPFKRQMVFEVLNKVLKS